LSDPASTEPMPQPGPAGGGPGTHAATIVGPRTPYPHAHQFDSIEQQRDASTIGMWLFLANEIMFFGGVFLAYAIYRGTYAEAFGEAAKHLQVGVGAFNTAVLITSSLTMALGVHACSEGRNRTAVLFLAATAFLGLVFIGVKAYEYEHKFHEHLFPGGAFAFPGPHEPQARIFFSLYFALTGLHALHMVIGVGLLAWVGILAWKDRFTPDYYSPIENVGLYWHFVDIVWIFLFPLLYLVG
jgi:cytochrome c oxidase subunit III